MARNIIDHIDQTDARVPTWLDDNYPTFIYKFIARCSWGITAVGAYLVVLSYWSRTAYATFVGLFVTVTGTVISTLLTLWARNALAMLRHTARREHPSYPYKWGR